MTETYDDGKQQLRKNQAEAKHKFLSSTLAKSVDAENAAVEDPGITSEGCGAIADNRPSVAGFGKPCQTL